MAATTQSGLFATKPVDRLVEDTHEKEHELSRAVGALDLTALGLGAIIGTGIFVIIGEAIGTAVSDLLYTRSYREAAADLRSEVLLRPTPASLVNDLEKLVVSAVA